MNWKVIAFCIASTWFLTSGTYKALAVEVSPEAQPVLTWSECLDLALQFNPEVLIRREKIRQVEGDIIVQRSNFLPGVRAGGGTTMPSVSIGLSVPVYSKAREPTFAAFPYARTAVMANAQLAVMEMAYQLRVAYIQAYYNQELVPVAQKELDLLEDRLKRAPSLFNAGKMTKADLESLQVREALAKSKLESVNNMAEISRLQLWQIIGLPASDSRLQGIFTTDFQLYATQETDPQKLISAAIEQRQDLRLLKNLKRVDEEIVLVDAKDYYPEIGAGTSFSNNFQPPNFVSPLFHELAPRSYNKDFLNQDFRSANQSFEMVANWRIYDGGSTASSIISARSEVVKQDILIQRILDQIPRQVALALEVINGTSASIKNLQTNGKAEESLQSLQQAYDAGQVSQVEILDAQDELILAREDLLLLESGHDQALAALDRLVGLTFHIDVTVP